MYDVAIVGAGAAGSSLAQHLLDSPLRERSIVLIEPHAEPQTHTWGFWTDRPTPLDHLVCRSWSRLRVAANGMERTLEARRYLYAMVRGEDFLADARSRLWRLPMIPAAVREIVDGPDAATVVLDAGAPCRARWVFDSRPPSILPGMLRQTFEGWEIEAPDDIFDPDVATFMDFRTARGPGMRFVYVLPTSARRALVEHVVCAAETPARGEQTKALREYVWNVLGLREPRVVRREAGETLLAADAAERRRGKRVMTIGRAGGRLQASTGYALQRIQRDSGAIVRSLTQNGHPFAVPPDSWRHARYQAPLLDLMYSDGRRAEEVFAALFASNPLDRILRFLDDATNPFEEVLVAATLPPWFWPRALSPSLLRRSA